MHWLTRLCVTDGKTISDDKCAPAYIGWYDRCYKALQNGENSAMKSVIKQYGSQLTDFYVQCKKVPPKCEYGKLAGSTPTKPICAHGEVPAGFATAYTLVNPGRFGTLIFLRTEKYMCNGKPVYKATGHDMFLWYPKNLERWMFTDEDNAKTCVATGYLYAQTSGSTPDKSRGWTQNADYGSCKITKSSPWCDTPVTQVIAGEHSGTQPPPIDLSG
jgi:hypothetical protein